LKAKNTDLSDSRKMLYRIGINVGDVIVEGERSATASISPPG
jgi:hypothetical protein